MKKFIMVSMIALIAAFGFVGCGSEDEGTTLKWTNDSDANLAEISWSSGTGTPDQTWGSYTSGTVNNFPIGNTTDSKNIETLLGQADALDEGGAAYTLELAAGEGVEEVGMGANPANAEIKENADARLIITAAKKK